MITIIDSLFDPLFQFFDQIQSQLDNMTTVTARGLDLDNYFGFFTILGTSWIGVIASFMSCLMFIFILYNIKTNSRVYLWFKDMIKWW